MWDEAGVTSPVSVLCAHSGVIHLPEPPAGSTCCSCKNITGYGETEIMKNKSLPRSQVSLHTCRLKCVRVCSVKQQASCRNVSKNTLKLSLKTLARGSSLAWHHCCCCFFVFINNHHWNEIPSLRCQFSGLKSDTNIDCIRSAGELSKMNAKTSWLCAHQKKFSQRWFLSFYVVIITLVL